MGQNVHIDQTGKMHKKNVGIPGEGLWEWQGPWRTQNTTPLKGPIWSSVHLCQFKSVIVQPSNQL